MIRFRSAPLLAAAVLAAGFVVLRILYRFVFGGLGDGLAAGSPVLLDLPKWRLSGPFSHISLFGPVTLDGLQNAFLSALPFALFLFAVGAVSAIIDMRAVFAHWASRGPLQGISRAFVIAWATFPALVDAAKRVRIAALLRGSRSPAAYLVPMFEQTIERALALAASMEVRGFAAGVSPVPAPVDALPVDASDFTVRRSESWRVSAESFAAHPGTLTVIAGHTGAGKSTFLHSISGLTQHFDEAEHSGELTVFGLHRGALPPRDTATLVGVVSQQPKLSFTAETVREELAFALTVRHDEPDQVRQRVEQVAADLGMSELLDRDTATLSAGQAMLVAIGAALTSRPPLLVLDEPLADLDARARKAVLRILDQLAHETGLAVVVAEHRTRHFVPIADAWWRVAGGAIVRSGAPEAAAGPAHPPLPRASKEMPAAAASVHDLSVWFPKSRGAARHDAVVKASLTLTPGEILALEGPNGAGKSSLLTVLALHGKRIPGMRYAGDVTVSGAFALVPEQFDDLFARTTVRAECGSAQTAAHFLDLVGASAPTAQQSARDALLETHPRDLSVGQRLCLAIAIQAADAPAVLALDEPTRGLDDRARRLVVDAVLTLSKRGTAIIVASHDDDFIAAVAHRRVELREGVLTP